MDCSLLLLGLTIFFGMAARLYKTSYSLHYFGVMPIDLPIIFESLMAGTLLAFLASKAGRLRSILWGIIGVYSISLLNLRSTTTDPQAKQYLDALIGRSEKISSVIQTGNKILDVILNGRLSIAVSSGIKLEIIRAEAPASLPLSDTDLCSLVLNLIDNALSAAQSSGAETPYIRLDLHVKNQFFVFICENAAPIVPQPSKKSQTVPKHGLGMKIVRQITDHYGDLINTESGEGFYKVTLAIQLAHPSR
jgi:signal transduction histidine kinase